MRTVAARPVVSRGEDDVEMTEDDDRVAYLAGEEGSTSTT